MDFWMNDLWAVGLTGGCVGATVSWPLLRPGAGTSEVTNRSLRMVGALLLGGSAATALIAVSHSPVPSANAEWLEHTQKLGNVLFWSAFTLWVRRSTGRGTPAAAAAVVFTLPLLGYAVYVGGAGSPPPFRWLLPIGAIAAVHALVCCARPVSATDSLEAGMRSRMVRLAAALCVAQAVRTFCPDVAALREIVPLTMTVGFVSIASFAMRRLFVERGGDRVELPKPSYARSTLDTNDAAAILAAIGRGMREHHWYRDADLSLHALASRVNATPHAVSQALNQVADRSLPEYLNAWRIDEARRLLSDPANDRFTIDGLALSAGFGSRSAFYKIFKAAEGVTPAEFRARSRPSGTGSPTTAL